MESVSGYSLMAADPAIVAELEAWYRSRGVKEHAVAMLATAQADKPLGRLMGNAEPILARLMAGETAKQIATSYGISKIALYAWLLRHVPDQWKEIKAGMAAARLDDSEETIAGAEDQLQATKGRELARIAQWQLERLDKSYAPKQDGNAGVTINVRVDPSAGGSVVIEGESSLIPDQS